MRSIYEAEILLVDDQIELCRMVKEMLKKAGFSRVEAAGCVRDCMARCNLRMPDLIVLDIGLPDGDGFSLMNEIRKLSDVPVLFLSARDEDEDRLLGLGLGADDYITKPFLPRELVLRLSAILKRTYGLAAHREEETLTLGDRIVDFPEAAVRRVGADGSREQRCVRLTAKEIIILKKLNESRGRIVTFDALSQALWGDFYYGYENSLMVHIRRLREKIEENPSCPKYLTTARGLGYKLERQEGEKS